MIKKIIVSLLIFVSFTGLFIILQLSTPDIIGTDSFFYLTKSSLLSQYGYNSESVWLTVSYFASNNSGLHFTFSYLLFPFITFFRLILGGKLFISLLNGLLFTVFFTILQKLNINKPFLWTIILFISSIVFLFRINLIRPLNISIIIFIILIYCLLKKKYWLLAIGSFIYPWFYDGFLVFLIPIIIFTLLLFNTKDKSWYKIFSIYILCTLLGLTINPFFPKNIYYLFSLDLMAFKNVIYNNLNVGLEWLPYTFSDFISQNLLIVILLITILVILFLCKINKQKFTFSLNFLIITTLLFFLLALKTIHFTEYFIPLIILLTAYTFSLFQNSSKSPEIKEFSSLLTSYFKKPFFKILLTLAFISLIFLPLKKVYFDFKTAYPVSRYQQTAEWLKNNTSEKSIIFHASWDSFPRLFYHNHHNYYLVGLDPTFMYLYDKNIYWLWRNITEKNTACNVPIDLVDSECTADQQTPQAIAQAINTQFNSEFIWVNDYPIYQEFKKFLEASPEFFEKKIETQDSSVFWIIK